MSKKKGKRGPKPKPADQVRGVLLPPVRVTNAESAEVRARCEQTGKTWTEWVRERLEIGRGS